MSFLLSLATKIGCEVSLHTVIFTQYKSNCFQVLLDWRTQHIDSFSFCVSNEGCNERAVLWDWVK